MQSEKITSAMVIFAAILIVTTPAMSQMSEEQKEVRAKIREMGSELTDDVIKGTAELYLPLHAQSPKNGVKITKDQSYGPHERNRLDVYEPENNASRMMPILLFVHGGAFISGDKNLTGIFAPYYGNIGHYFASHGVVTVLATYRLAPEHKWPSGAEDIAKAIKWIQANGATFGGDPNKIFLMGHSAGACHAGTYIFHEELQPDKGDGVLGAILMSGLYDPRVTAVPAEANLSYYGKDASQYASMAAIRHIEGRDIPVFIVFAEFDPDFFQMQAAELFRALCQRDNSCPRIKQLANHNHMSEVQHINTADDSIGPEILDFIQSNIR